MTHGYTTIEQSKHLVELGLAPSTADMYYKYVLPKSDKLHHVPDVGEPTNALSWYNKGYTLNGRKEPLELKDFCIPCWSLAALLELMPFFITIKEEGEPDEYYHFQLNRNGSVFRSKWQASYHGLKTKRGKVHTRIIPWAVGPNGESDTPIDTAFEMVCWLIEQKHIKVNK